MLAVSVVDVHSQSEEVSWSGVLLSVCPPVSLFLHLIPLEWVRVPALLR